MADLLQWNIQPLPPNKLTGDGGLRSSRGISCGRVAADQPIGGAHSTVQMVPAKSRVCISHKGIITLLVGQIVTDVLQEESFVHMERGDRRTPVFDDNELIFMLPVEGGPPIAWSRFRNPCLRKARW